MLCIDALVFFNKHLAVTVCNVKARDLAFPAITHKLHHAAFRLQFELIELEEL